MVRFRVFTLLAVLCLGGCSAKAPATANTPEQRQAIAQLRQAYAAFNRGDINAAVQPLDPGIEWSEPAEFPGGGTYHGVEAVKGYLARSRAGWAEGASQPAQFIARGNQVVVFVHARFRAKDASEWHTVDLADVYTFHNGKAVRMQAFADRRQALKSVGIAATAQ